MATLRGGQVDGTEDDDWIELSETSPNTVFGDGKDGNDTIIAYSGSGTIAGGEGDDLIRTWNGDFTIDGGGGDDTIYAGPGDLSINGGGGDDVIDVSGPIGSNATTIQGGDGFDTLVISDFAILFDASLGGVERLELNGSLWIMESDVVDRSGRNLYEIGSSTWNE